MNKKGFTLIELLLTFIILGVVLGISVYSINAIFGNAKGKTEEVFIGTIKDSLDIYLTSRQAKGLTFNHTCSSSLTKTYGVATVYKATTTFKSVIDSEFKPITQKDLVNPNNEEKKCNDANNILIDIYRDSDYVYYYKVNMSSFGCLTQNDIISNLPEGFVC